MLENFLEFNVSGACIAIIATLLGAGYPLFLNLFKDINSVYSSNLILTEIKSDRYFVGYQRWLELSLLALLLWGCGLKPIFSFNIDTLDIVLNNSAEILLLIATSFLVVNFIMFVKVSFKFYQPYETATKLIGKYKETIQED